MSYQYLMVFHYRDGHNVIFDIDDDLFRPTKNLNIFFDMMRRYPDDRKYSDVWGSLVNDEINYFYVLTFFQIISCANF